MKKPKAKTVELTIRFEGMKQDILTWHFRNQWRNFAHRMEMMLLDESTEVKWSQFRKGVATIWVTRRKPCPT